LWDGFSKFATSYQLSHVGGIAGVIGLASVVLCLVFGQGFAKALRILGILCLAGFIYDYLPEESHWRYLVVLIGMVLLIVALWFRTRDVFIMLIPWGPYLIRLYVAASQIAYWRFVIIGFMLLGVGTAVSLFKRSAGGQIEQDNGP